MKNILKKSYKLNRFKNMLVYGVRTIVSFSPAIGYLALSQNLLVFGTLQLLVLDLFIMYNVFVKESKIKEFINKKEIQQINNKINNLLIKVRKDDLNDEDIKDIAHIFLMKKEILALNNIILNESNYYMLKENNTLLSKYKTLKNLLLSNNNKKEYKKHIDEYMFNEKENLNLKLVFDNSYIKNMFKYRYNDIERFNFILSESYTLQKEDYNDLNEIIKNLDKYSNYDLFNFLNRETLKADWNFIKEMIIKDYNSDNFNYEKLIKLLDSKKIESYSNYLITSDLSNYKKENNHQKDVDILLNELRIDKKENNSNIKNVDEKIKNHILFDYDMKNNKELWFNLKSSYEYLLKNNYQKDVDILLNDSLPILIDYDLKLNELRSDKIKQQTIENSKQILLLLNKDLLGIIENMESNKLKDIKILAKYQSMKI